MEMALDAGRCAEDLKSINLATTLQEEPTIAPILAMIIPTRYLLQGVARGGAPNLQFIFLSNVFLEADSPLFVALQEESALPFLETIWFSNCGMNDDMVECLASALLRRSGKGLRSLYIQNDRRVGPRGCVALADALIKGASPGLDELDLSGTSVGLEGCRAVIWCLGAG